VEESGVHGENHRRCTRYTLCDKACQWLVACRWFSPCTPDSSTNKANRNEILLKVALTLNLTLCFRKRYIHYYLWYIWWLQYDQRTDYSIRTNVHFSNATANTSGVDTSRKSRTNRQHNGQEKKDKKTNNDLQNTAQKTKDRVTRTPLNTGCELRRSGWGSSIYSTSVSCCIRKMYVCPNRIIWRKKSSNKYSSMHTEWPTVEAIFMIIQM
jgi:hypothetical protein